MVDLLLEEEEYDPVRRKMEIVSDLRALVTHPGWQYLCSVLRNQMAHVRASVTEATSLDALLRINSELREVSTYQYLLDLPAITITEFELDLEGQSDDRTE